MAARSHGDGAGGEGGLLATRRTKVSSSLFAESVFEFSFSTRARERFC